ncbi:GTP 3',8-cyclase MoaA [Arachidicoccus terrestris]|uniref:GTP 3',8-cyclase MoaA n=1 Tax=Arachidicoccus terrestris TaxID=2875539 RepID=UPI001CC798FC|nr:GTP 3',8-cyclase MoaA [Arachidicoccus terrestris]UAY56701.1 GTP 3',8-cyclase MoaA [Arachidicoccus terrestris]
MITDGHGRTINYLRLAVTDRCNLRCTYCMPESGLDWTPRSELITTPEMLRICTLLIKMGIDKIRITGGEPFVRKDLLPFLHALSVISGLQELTITTNGLLTAPFIPELKKMGIRSVNLSLDSLDQDRFIAITRRDGLAQVLGTLDALLANGIAVKINAVVMEERNIEDIIPLAELTQSLPVSVRFIEEMPFNGTMQNVSLAWNSQRILSHLKERFPTLKKAVDESHATALNYDIPGHKGRVGLIPAYTRSFCGSCNRLRITPTGTLRTCLYEAGQLNLKDRIREGYTDEMLARLVRNAVMKKPLDGWAAERGLIANNLAHQSMATIGG